MGYESQESPEKNPKAYPEQNPDKPLLLAQIPSRAELDRIETNATKPVYEYLEVSDWRKLKTELEKIKGETLEPMKYGDRLQYVDTLTTTLPEQMTMVAYLRGWDTTTTKKHFKQMLKDLNEWAIDKDDFDDVPDSWKTFPLAYPDAIKPEMKIEPTQKTEIFLKMQRIIQENWHDEFKKLDEKSDASEKSEIFYDKQQKEFIEKWILSRAPEYMLATAAVKGTSIDQLLRGFENHVDELFERCKP